MGHEPIQARRTGIFTRGCKWIRRNPTTGALIPLSAAFLAALGMLLARRAPELPPAGIAVLPFENLNGDKADAAFADGVQAEILTGLARIADLKVISRTSVMDYRGKRNARNIGQALKVAYLLEGSVRRAGGRVRLDTELIDTRTDANIWAQQYDRELKDVFAVQSEIAQTIAEQLHAKLSPNEKAAIEKPPTRDLVAYNLYLQAVALIDPTLDTAEFSPDAVRGIELLDEAVARDPAFLLAYCKLAQAEDFLYCQGGRAPEDLARANSALQVALRLGPDSGEAHLSLALHLYWGKSDYDRARAELALASRTLPNNARIAKVAGLIDRRQGHWSEAVREFERSVELDPRNPAPLQDLMSTLCMMRSYGKASEVYDRLSALNRHRNEAHIFLAWLALEGKADTKPLHFALQKFLADHSDEVEPDLGFRLHLYERDFVAADRDLAAQGEKSTLKAGTNGAIELSRSFWMGLVAHLRGDLTAERTEFSDARARQEESVHARPDYGPDLIALALTDALLGRKQEALREGKRAVEMLPVEKNALEGTDVLCFFAIICGWVGERDLAFEQLEILAKLPAGPSYGNLCLDPLWNPLRSDPRFDKIVASLAPKEVTFK